MIVVLKANAPAPIAPRVLAAAAAAVVAIPAKDKNANAIKLPANELEPLAENPNSGSFTKGTEHSYC